MSWLFSARLRPFVLTAAVASLLLNLALIVPAIYMMQVFDRVFASRSIETLAMLTVLAALAIALGFCMDVLRARALAFAGREIDRRMSPTALTNALQDAAGAAGRTGTDALRDIAQLRALLSGSAPLALFDAPWLPIYLLVIGLMHPLLGIAATLGASMLVALGVLTERLMRLRTEHALRCARETNKHAESLTRNAEVIIGMGMTRAAMTQWGSRHEELLSAQTALSRAGARLGAIA